MNRSTARVIKVAPALILLAILSLLPLTGPSPNLTRLLFTTLVWATASIAWNLLGGLTGQVSFGFAVFFGLGAYTTALLMNDGLAPSMAFLAGAAVASLASLLIGLPTFRLRGPYFAIATIGLSEAVRVVMGNVTITGGASGYRILEHRPFNQIEHYYTALVLALIAFAVSVLIRNSKFGLGLLAIREDQDTASDLGVNPFVYKLSAHWVAAALTGAAGGVFARYSAFIHPGGVFAFQTSVTILLMPVIGGLGTLWGPVAGAFVFTVVEEQLIAAFPQFHLLLYGALLILIVLVEPGGLIGIMYRIAATRHFVAATLGGRR